MFPDLRAETIHQRRDAGRRYRVTVVVPNYGSRRVNISFRQNMPNTPCVTVDGPSESPHRYPSGDLCMWHPTDPPEHRWIVKDGLMQLLAHIIAHLIREGWWRKTGEWPGPEASHVPPQVKTMPKAG